MFISLQGVWVGLSWSFFRNPYTPNLNPMNKTIEINYFHRTGRQQSAAWQEGTGTTRANGRCWAGCVHKSDHLRQGRETNQGRLFVRCCSLRQPLEDRLWSSMLFVQFVECIRNFVFRGMLFLHKAGDSLTYVHDDFNLFSCSLNLIQSCIILDWVMFSVWIQTLVFSHDSYQQIGILPEAGF